LPHIWRPTMCDAIDVDRLLAMISARLYPIDPITGLRIYNPDGKLTISVDEDEQTATDHSGVSSAPSHPAGASRNQATVERLRERLNPTTSESVRQCFNG
jgi:hypothetical protein